MNDRVVRSQGLFPLLLDHAQGTAPPPGWTQVQTNTAPGKAWPPSQRTWKRVASQENALSDAGAAPGGQEQDQDLLGVQRGRVGSWHSTLCPTRASGHQTLIPVRVVQLDALAQACTCSCEMKERWGQGRHHSAFPLQPHLVSGAQREGERTHPLSPRAACLLTERMK